MMDYSCIFSGFRTVFKSHDGRIRGLTSFLRPPPYSPNAEKFSALQNISYTFEYASASPCCCWQCGQTAAARCPTAPKHVYAERRRRRRRRLPWRLWRVQDAWYGSNGEGRGSQTIRTRPIRRAVRLDATYSAAEPRPNRARKDRQTRPHHRQRRRCVRRIVCRAAG